MKMKTSKKLFAIPLCLIMVCSTFVLSVGAEELQIDTEIQSNVETCGDYEYEILEDGKSIAITKYIGDDDVIDVIVPSIISGYEVKIIRQFAFDGSIDWEDSGLFWMYRP